MKILGKVILYILIYWLLSSFLDNAESYTIDQMVSDADKTLENLMPKKLAEEGFLKGSQVINTDTWQYGLFYGEGNHLISLAVVLIFYLGVDKKVWKR